MLSKRERLEQTIAGEATDRAPIALWRHWPGDDLRPSDLVQCLLNFQQRWDFDLINIMPAMASFGADYGLQAQWKGDLRGYPNITSHPITRSLDWTDLQILDPNRGQFGQIQEIVRLMKEAVKGPLPFILTVYSPLSMAALLAGESLLLQHIRTQPERLKTGLNILAGNILRLLDTLQQYGLSGICYTMLQADLAFLSLAEIDQFGRPYDLQVLEGLSRQWWLNMVNIRGQLPQVMLAAEYPVQVLNWSDQNTDIDLAAGKLAFRGAVCGGLDASATVHDGTPRAVREEARHAFDITNNRRLILGTGEPLLLTTPQSNIRAARDAIEISEIEL